MSRVAKRLNLGVDYIVGDRFKKSKDIQPLKEQVELFMLGAWCRDLHVGGSRVIGVSVPATGDYDLVEWHPVIIDNVNDQLGGFTDGFGATLVVEFMYFIRVSDTGFTVTPKVAYGTDMSNLTTVATISGEAACSATSAAYTGTDQVQNVAFTLPAALKWFKPFFTVGGAPDNGSQAWVDVTHNRYIQS